MVKLSGSSIRTDHLYRMVQTATKVKMFDPLCEVQSDKATVEITSPYDGVINELIVPEGSSIRVGNNICLIEVEQEVTESSSPAPESDIKPTLGDCFASKAMSKI